MMAGDLRPAVAWLHRWLGLALGAVFALLGLTGSMLVFYVEIDEARHGPVGVANQPAPQRVLDRLRMLHPERTGPWRIELPLAPGRPLRARYYAPVETSERMFAPLLVTLDPVSLEVLAQGFWGGDPFTWIYDLHYALQFERAGRTAVGWLGFVLVAGIASGLLLWWRGRSRRWLAWRPLPRSGSVRRTYDLHLLAGLYGALPLVLLGLTGALLALPEVTRVVAPVSAAPVPTGVDDLADGMRLLDLNEAIRIARSRFPDGDVRWIHSTGTAGEPVMFRIARPGDPGRRFPHTWLWLHPATGATLHVEDVATLDPGGIVQAWLHPLHSGEAFGLAGRWILFVVGLLPALAFATGLIRHGQKRRARVESRHGAGRAAERMVN